MGNDSGLLILPGHPLFNLTAGGCLPPDWRAKAEELGQFPNFVVSPETGLMRPASHEEMIDYIQGGEYDARLEVVDQEPDVDVVFLDLDRGVATRW